jgi:hypothetical protein
MSYVIKFYHVVFLEHKGMFFTTYEKIMILIKMYNNVHYKINENFRYSFIYKICHYWLMLEVYIEDKSCMEHTVLYMDGKMNSL